MSIYKPDLKLEIFRSLKHNYPKIINIINSVPTFNSLGDSDEFWIHLLSINFNIVYKESILYPSLSSEDVFRFYCNDIQIFYGDTYILYSHEFNFNSSQLLQSILLFYKLNNKSMKITQLVKRLNNEIYYRDISITEQTITIPQQFQNINYPINIIDNSIILSIKYDDINLNQLLFPPKYPDSIFGFTYDNLYILTPIHPDFSDAFEYLLTQLQLSYTLTSRYPQLYST